MCVKICEMVQVITVDDEEYEVIPSASVSASRMLIDAYEKLGKPEDPYSAAGEKLMEVIYSIWQDLYPKEHQQWLQNKRDYKSMEMTASEQARKQTGRSLATVPSPVYKLMKKVFPNFRLSSRDSWIKFVKRYPQYRMTETGV